MIFEENESASITEQAAEMMKTFLRADVKPPKIGQWKDKYKRDVMRLIWECHMEEIPPPVDLVMLVGCLFGDRHDWPVSKFAAISFLAHTYEPIQLGESLPEGAKTGISEILKEHGGVLKAARPLDDEAGNDERDYRRTADTWAKEPLFIYLWAQKYDRYQARKHDRADLVAVAKEALAASNSENT